MQNLMNDLTKLFRKDERIFADGKLLKNKLTELALKLDQPLIELLLSNNKAKEQFFIDKAIKTEKVLVFDKDKFIAFVNNKEFLPDSFTSFKNKIGLMTNGDYLKEKSDVVLAWAYKDCVLEGGQDKEDQKRDEIFYNETLSPDEIDRLFEPKVMTNFKKYDSEGEHKITELNADDNLIIKGNNLLTLHCLKQKFIGHVKLIYIDPPFNTGSDSFGYNDRFNQATWLTFIMNRVKIAKDFLAEDGIFAIQCSFHQYAYLKVLLDEIFKKDNHLCTFNILVRHPDRILTGDKEFNDVIEYILFYRVSEETKFPKKEIPKEIDDYIYKIRETGKPHKIKLGDKDVIIFVPGSYVIEKQSPSADYFKKISVRGSIREKNSSGRFYVKYLEALKGKYSPLTLFRVPDIGDDKYNFRYFYLPKEGYKNGGYYQGKPTSSDITKKPYPNYYDFEEAYNNVSEEGGVSLRNAKKPEELLKFLIELFTKQGDIVMDFFMGSGTTCAVAHKLWRQYIGIEQLDYGKNGPVKRIINVIGNDDTGISSAINWKGGGSFVYAELKEWNDQYMTGIEEADTTRKLLNIYEGMQKEAFFRYDVDLSKFKEKEFEKLPLKEQKQVLCECLDKNHLYVNLSEIDDATYKVSVDDKKLNKEFYKTVV